MAQQHIRNIFTNPLTVQEQLREAQIATLRMALIKQEIAAALHKPVSAVDSDDVFDFNGPDWPYRALRPAPEAEWPAPLPSLLTEGCDDGDL